MALKSKPLGQVRRGIPADAAARADLVRINLNVPRALRAQWKVIAIQRGTTLADLILDAMRRHSKPPVEEIPLADKPSNIVNE